MFGTRVTARDPEGAPYLTGSTNVVFNADYDDTGFGPGWGTFTLKLDAGGAWEGTVQGIRSVVSEGWKEDLKLEAYGTGGSVDGKILQITDELTSYKFQADQTIAIEFTGSGQATMISP